MDIEIRKLTPDLAEEYVNFFDTTAHDVNIDEHKCYCVTWRSDESYIGNGDHWYPTRKERRERALQFVKDGYLQGYLAYCGDKIMGWCNATANCQGCLDYLRSFWPIEAYCADRKVKSVFCFMIAPEMQRKGVATKLLERICKDATDDGFDFVEAYADVNETRVFDTPHNFMGHFAMYEKCGFNKYAEQEGKIVMRKALK